MKTCQNKACLNPSGNLENAEYCMSCGFKLEQATVSNVTTGGTSRPNNITVLKRDTQTTMIESYNQWINNQIGIPMTYIPKGRYWMGSNGNELNSSVSERPQHFVSIPPIYLSVYPITQEQYKIVMDGKNPSIHQGDENPVESVSYFQAIDFCDRLSHRTNKTYRLPTEGEWEYSCRAGEFNVMYNFGNNIDINKACYKFSNFNGNPDRPAKIGNHKPNGFNLHDMHGNVWEWCLDSWQQNYKNTPKDGSAWIDHETELKVIRGGSWNSLKSECRSASRSSLKADSCRNDVGFRVVCEG